MMEAARGCCRQKATPAEPVPPSFFVVDYKAGKEQPSNARLAVTKEALSPLPTRGLTEREFTRAYEGIDKAFCVAWLDARTALVGTKCNSLFKLDLLTGQRKQLQLPVEPHPPGGASPPERNWLGHCGMHALAVNPGATLVATGGRATEDVVILRGSDLSPVQTFQGHVDWVFGLAWLTDKHVASASRDHTVRLWQVYDDGTYQTTAGVATRVVQAHTSKVRDLRFNEDRQCLLSLGVEGCLHVWDRTLERVQRLVLPHTQELVCTATCGALAAVGSKTHVDLLDLRSGELVGSSEHHRPHGASGVRSLQFKTEALLSFGTGSSSIVFLDLRMLRAQREADGGRTGPALKEPPANWCAAQTLQLSRGRVDDAYRQFFSNVEVFSACYAHEWDSTGTKVLTVGGPLMYGLRGIYMALWE